MRPETAPAICVDPAAARRGQTESAADLPIRHRVTAVVAVRLAFMRDTLPLTDRDE